MSTNGNSRGGWRLSLYRLNLKQAVIIFLLILITVEATRRSWLPILSHIAITVAAAVILDLPLNRWLRKKPLSMVSATSAIISGLLIAIVLAPGRLWFVPLTASAIAIGSKHLIRFRKHHIFNPATFGLVAVSIIFSKTFSWWGANWIPLVIIFGVYIVYRIRAYSLVISFLIVYCTLLASWAILSKASVWSYVSALNLFFVLFMLTEHQTAPGGGIPRTIYGALAGVLCFVFLRTIPQHGPYLLGLLTANLSTPLLRRISSTNTGRKK